jgi:sec-independent protein translocase protein TatB
MFGTLGGPELFLILVIALIVFGPRALPDIGKSIGKMLVEFRRASNDFKRTIEEEVEADKLKSALDAGGDRPPSLAPPAPPLSETREAEPYAAPAVEPEPAAGSVSREAGTSDGPKA